jgi:hypothetical protein
MQFIAAIAMCALPTLATAQSEASSIASCVVTLVCSQEGRCETASETIVFTFTPKDVQRHGEGTYELNYAGTTTTARMLTPFGPWVWGSDDKLQTLVSIGALRDDQDENPIGFMTLSGLTFSEPPTGTVKFLQCRDAP